MKLMSQNTSGLEERLKRATKEARIWEQLQHSNVAEFFYTIPMPETLLDQIVVVSPWSDGCGTGNATASSFLLDPANIEATPMIIQGIIAGLEYMHDPTTKPAVFHGDLKGNNILIFGTREAPIPRITDFGLSKMEAPDSSAPSVVIGAAHWAAPELFGTGDSSTVISAQSDVWSLGATIFELVTGRPLFHDKQFIAVVCFYVLETRRHREQEVADYLMCLPDPVRQVVHRIFVEDIAVRPTATDVSIMWETLRTQVQIHEHSWRSLMTTVQAPHFLHNRVTNPDGGRVLSDGEWATWMTNQREQRG
ncbi:kinase-like protein [Sistotremastrum niveocremeum HHB9708]|uniref:non-specific serine/threonine protein kinase n=1 Tax=Sistotremastrum niveocremeum HHB9708 TaxID=1314777 RepID=A0A164YGP8_9AGAM|nr:kinase-like protein [Sistotremastrum niveocremeum HHB9708]